MVKRWRPLPDQWQLVPGYGREIVVLIVKPNIKCHCIQRAVIAIRFLLAMR